MLEVSPSGLGLTGGGNSGVYKLPEGYSIHYLVVALYPGLSY